MNRFLDHDDGKLQAPPLIVPYGVSDDIALDLIGRTVAGVGANAISSFTLVTPAPVVVHVKSSAENFEIKRVAPEQALQSVDIKTAVERSTVGVAGGTGGKRV